MVGVQDQAGVEDLDLALTGGTAGDLEEEVRRHAQLGVRVGDDGTGPGRVVAGDEDRLLRGQPGGLAQVRLGVVGVLVRIITSGQRDQCAQRLHRGLLLRDLRDVGLDESAERTSSNQLLLVRRQLFPCGECAVLQKVGDLFEGGAVGQIVDVVATIEEATGLTVDVTERCGRGYDIGEAFGGLVRHECFLRLSVPEVYL